MTDQELIKALCEDVEWALANEWETPITLGDDLTEAADRLEALAAENELLYREVAKLKAECDHFRDLTKKLWCEKRYSEDTNVPTKWVSVDERLPEPEEPVLCHCADGKLRVMSWDHIIDDWDFAIIYGHCHALSRGSVTHWQPLPEPPSTEGVE